METPILFTHVPKTGGSTITRGMAAIFGHDSIAGISTAEPEDRRAFLNASRNSGKLYVYGHFRFNDASPVFERANYIVSLRHPLERMLSLYFMLLRNENGLANQCSRDVKGEGFRLFHHRFVDRRQQDNLMCRYICGEPYHRPAIEALQNYSLVWSSDNTDEAWTYLYRTLKRSVPKPLTRYNVAPLAKDDEQQRKGARPQEYRGFLTPENQTLLEEVHREDVKLFNWFIGGGRTVWSPNGSVPDAN